MNTITFTATITVRDDCEDMTDEQLLAFAEWQLSAGSFIEIDNIEQTKEQG